MPTLGIAESQNIVKKKSSPRIARRFSCSFGQGIAGGHLGRELEREQEPFFGIVGARSTEEAGSVRLSVRIIPEDSRANGY